MMLLLSAAAHGYSSSSTETQLSAETSPKEIAGIGTARQSHFQTSTLSTSKSRAKIHQASTSLVCKALPNPTSSSRALLDCWKGRRQSPKVWLKKGFFAA